MRRIIFILLAFMLVLTACHTAQRVAGKDRIVEIQFGSGGGFSGKYTTFSLDSRGALYRLNGDQRTKIQDISEDDCRRIMEMASSLDKSDSSSGNMSCFIRVIYRGKTIERTWPMGSGTDSSVLDLYRELDKLK